MTGVYSSPYGRSSASSSSRRNGGKNSNNNDRSKRQFRVAQYVQTELARILHTGLIKGTKEVNGPAIPSNLRQRISIVSVDISPDLRQARVSVSIRPPAGASGSSSNGMTASRVMDNDDDDDGDDDNDDIDDDDDDDGTGSSAVVDRRRAYSWLVDNTKSIRHTLAQRLSHMKSSAPNLQFVLVDVSAAVDVMYLIDKVSKGYERESLDTEFMFSEDDDDDEEWEDMDESFFND
jgi:ribosome-binding factor A